MPEHWSNAVSDIINTLQSARNSSQVKFWYNENLLVCMVQIKCSHTPLVALPDWLTHPGCNCKLSKIGYRHWEFWNNTNGKVPGWEWNGKKIMDKSTCLLTAVISHTCPPTIFFPISKTTFWWTSIKCIHDNNGERSHRNGYFNVNSQSIWVALSSLLDSSIKRNWEVRL